MSDKLKLCPCGSPAAEPWFDEDAECGEVYCTKCTFSARGDHVGWWGDPSDKSESISKAIDAWNTRTTTPAEAARVLIEAYETAKFPSAIMRLGLSGQPHAMLRAIADGGDQP